jgi:hypothetical protein
VDWAKGGEHRWDYQLKRIRLSFSGKGEKIIASLEAHNRSLRELLDSDEKLDNMRDPRKDTTWANVFDCIRRHARSLHAALKGGWNCDCETPHTAALRLQQRSMGGWSSKFNVAFDIPKDPKDPKSSTNVRREIAISIKGQNKAEEGTSETKSISSPIPDDWVDRLRGNFESKSSPAVSGTSSPIPPRSTPSLSQPSRTSFKNIFSKSNLGCSTTIVSTEKNEPGVLTYNTEARYVTAAQMTSEALPF